MITLLHVLRLFPFLCGGRRQLALENLALRQQLAVYKRAMNRPRLQLSDRLLWVWLSRVWPAWKQALVIVAPATVLSWQRRRFSPPLGQALRRPSDGPPTRRRRDQSSGQKNGRRQFLWGARKIHPELLKLGIDVADRTVSWLMPKRRPLPSQTCTRFRSSST